MPMETIINKTTNGSVVKTEERSDYQVEFFSMVFILNRKEYSEFSRAVSSIDIDYWMKLSLKETHRRRIQVYLASRTINLNLTRNELQELQQLLMPRIKLFRHLRSKIMDNRSILAYYN